jgi:hypothetical protein
MSPILFDSARLPRAHSFGATLLSFDHTPEGWGDIPDVINGRPVWGLGMADAPADLAADEESTGLVDHLADLDLAAFDIDECMATHRRWYREAFSACLDAECPVPAPSGLNADDRESWEDGSRVAGEYVQARHGVEVAHMVGVAKRSPSYRSLDERLAEQEQRQVELDHVCAGHPWL